jgi:GNAT superfamily N-acetyltransferase
MSEARSDRVALEVAELHTRYIKQGVLPMLGLKFLTLLYDRIAVSPRATVQVAFSSQRVCGFIAGCYNIRSTYLHLGSHYGVALLSAAGHNLFAAPVLRRFWPLLAYPLQVHEKNRRASVPSPEILSIAVDEKFRKEGIGRQLVKAFETATKGWGEMERFRVATNLAETGARQFYERLGFRPIRRVRHHDLVLQIYETPLPLTCSPDGTLREQAQT